MSKQSQEQHRYQKLIEEVFFKNYEKNSTEVSFLRDDFEKVANELEMRLPKNLGDIIYSFRFRTPLPDYSPNLNLIERLWKFFNEKVRNNRYDGTFSQFTEACKKNSFVAERNGRKNYALDSHKIFTNSIPIFQVIRVSENNDRFSIHFFYRINYGKIVKLRGDKTPNS